MPFQIMLFARKVKNVFRKPYSIYEHVILSEVPAATSGTSSRLRNVMRIKTASSSAYFKFEKSSCCVTVTIS